MDVTSLIFRNLAASDANLPVLSVRGIFRGISMCILMSFFSRFYAVSFYDLSSLGNFIVLALT